MVVLMSRSVLVNFLAVKSPECLRKLDFIRFCIYIIMVYRVGLKVLKSTYVNKQLLFFVNLRYWLIVVSGRKSLKKECTALFHFVSLCDLLIFFGGIFHFFLWVLYFFVTFFQNYTKLILRDLPLELSYCNFATYIRCEFLVWA